MTSAAFNSGLWTAWRPDGRLQGSPGSGLCSPSQSAQASDHTPIRTQQGHHVSGVPSIILGHTRQEEGEWWPLSDLHCAMATPQTQLAFSCPRQLGSVRHECLSSSLMPEELLWGWQQTTKLLFLQDPLLNLCLLLTSPGF